MTEPITKTVADLDPATLPLAGTELTFVMQGGEPKRAPVSSFGGGGGYIFNGNYLPTVTGIDAGTLALETYEDEEEVEHDIPLGYTRVGSSPVAAAGDTVTVFGIVYAGTVAAGPTLGGGTITLPFAPDPTKPVTATALSGYMDRLVDASALVYPLFGAVLLVRGIGVADGPQRVQVSYTYQTANAVDP